MKPIEEVYPDALDDEGYFNGVYDYWPMLESMDFEILCSASLGSYEGSYLLLLRDGGRYGFVDVGYGSCSVCDLLQSCDSVAEVESVRQGIIDEIRWEDSADLMLTYLNEKDWDAQWYTRSSPDAMATFMAECTKHLTAP